MFFSIIIPIYNSEKSLTKCLEAIKVQSFNDFEVIMVDDGSNDNSMFVCQSIVSNDYRFRVIHQDNRGPSAARNTGLKAAEGEYICFVDSDDYVAENYLESLKKFIDNDQPDMVFFGYHRVDHKGQAFETILPPGDIQGIPLLNMLSERNMFGYTWIKCISRKILSDVIFPEDMSLFEDEVFTCHVSGNANKISVLKKALYNYVTDGNNMLTRKTHKDYCVLSDKVYLAWENLLKNESGSKMLLEQKANGFVRRCVYYGFEHNVNKKIYFHSLARSYIFAIHTSNTMMDRMIRKENYLGIYTAFIVYQCKIGIYKVISNCKKKLEN